MAGSRIVDALASAERPVLYAGGNPNAASLWKALEADGARDGVGDGGIPDRAVAVGGAAALNLAYGHGLADTEPGAGGGRGR